MNDDNHRQYDMVHVDVYVDYMVLGLRRTSGHR